MSINLKSVKAKSSLKQIYKEILETEKRIDEKLKKLKNIQGKAEGNNFSDKDIEKILQEGVYAIASQIYNHIFGNNNSNSSVEQLIKAGTNGALYGAINAAGPLYSTVQQAISSALGYGGACNPMSKQQKARDNLDNLSEDI